MNNNQELFSDRLVYRSYKTEEHAGTCKAVHRKNLSALVLFSPNDERKNAREQIEKNKAMWLKGIDITKDRFAFAIVRNCPVSLLVFDRTLCLCAVN